MFNEWRTLTLFLQFIFQNKKISSPSFKLNAMHRSGYHLSSRKWKISLGFYLKCYHFLFSSSLSVWISYLLHRLLSENDGDICHYILINCVPQGRRISNNCEEIIICHQYIQTLFSATDTWSVQCTTKFSSPYLDCVNLFHLIYSISVHLILFQNGI